MTDFTINENDDSKTTKSGYHIGYVGLAVLRRRNNV